jgi:hypothetical protein
MRLCLAFALCCGKSLSLLVCIRFPQGGEKRTGLVCLHFTAGCLGMFGLRSVGICTADVTFAAPRSGAHVLRAPSLGLLPSWPMAGLE